MSYTHCLTTIPIHWLRIHCTWLQVVCTMLKMLSRVGFIRTMAVRSQSTASFIANMPPCDFVPEKYTGPSHDTMKQLRQNHLSSGQLTYYKDPISLCQGHMQYLYDLEGNRYLDMFAGIATVIAGHCHPKIQEATLSQMSKMWHSTNIYYHPSIHEYAEKLTSTLPDPLKVCYFVNSGSEANDLALLMARLYTGCMDTFVMRGAYHGASPITMGLTSLSTWFFNYPSASSIHKIRNADPYKGPYGGKACRDSVVQADRSCDCQPGQCMASEQYLEEVKRCPHVLCS
ncbi:hypothetical protein EB796_018940 [Bugula neritina]|uniref:Alanine--glyoxylate aminotransferase 2, mitochondrial n=1 Tax=Bugula neritina TaxID=10212 RepID=A0A7J7J9R5_BUGNE|nr:hypothetical protein EB796_018940 [Bugula neritina]